MSNLPENSVWKSCVNGVSGNKKILTLWYPFAGRPDDRRHRKEPRSLSFVLGTMNMDQAPFSDTPGRMHRGSKCARPTPPRRHRTYRRARPWRPSPEASVRSKVAGYGTAAEPCRHSTELIRIKRRRPDMTRETPGHSAPWLWRTKRTLPALRSRKTWSA